MGIGGILWARDFSRVKLHVGSGEGADVKWEHTFILKAEGDQRRTGFSVDDPKGFLEALERVCGGVTRREVPDKEEGLHAWKGKWIQDEK